MRTPALSKLHSVTLSIFLYFHLSGCTADANAPEQVHIAFGNHSTTIVITWVTQNETQNSLVKYRLDGNWMYTRGHQKMFQDEGSEHRIIYIHRVTLTDLMPEKTYSYACGDGNEWSGTFQFNTIPDHTNWTVRLAVFGDMGITNDHALPELLREVEHLNSFDAILHVGDFAYNMDTDNGRYGDIFMRQIEPIASKVPYMTAMGNHEQLHNFSHYKERFSMPGGDGQSQFYSFNIGPVHVIMFSTEFYYYLQYGWRQVVNQFQWIEADLKEANKPENRALRPWIMAMGHRPMYCSNSVDLMHCNYVDNLVRTGFPLPRHDQPGYILGLEELFYQHGVDVIVGAHEHSYERFWPVYNRKVCNGSTAQPYVEPQAPVHIVTGSAGCSEGINPFQKIPKPWSAFHSVDYGFTRMHVYNSSHLYVEQISVNEDGTKNGIIDSFTVVKEKHGPGLYSCHLQSASTFTPWMRLQPAERLCG